MSLRKLRKQINTRTLQSCFDALRLNKEQSKLELMHEKLNGDCEPEMRELEEMLR